MSNNLPAVPGQVAYSDRPDAVRVISHNDIPPIVQRMQRLQIADETLEVERQRYQSNAPLTVMNPNERAAQAALDALDQGRVLIDLDETMRKAVDRKQVKLAIARPSSTEVYLRTVIDRDHEPVRHEFSERRPRARRKPFYVIDRNNEDSPTGDRVYRALTPPIPAEVRADHPELLKDRRYLLLWEADWQLVSVRNPRPPLLDPALLYQVAGVLYSVVAVWNLTSVEQAALKPGPQF